ncbi:MAG TPA: SPFH domain-containing protein [Armatimonadota bacterium]
MGLVLMLVGVALLAAGMGVVPGLTGMARIVCVIFGGVVFLVGAILAFIMALYRKASADQAFVRTGAGGPAVVMDGGAVVIPTFHRVLDVNLQTMKLAVNPKGRNALITRDNLRSDVLAQFYIKVQPDRDHILMAARSLGENSVNAETVENLVSEKLVSALRAIASQMDLFEIHTKRDEFAERVKEHVRADLEANGLLLESVTISELDQTDPSELDDNNVFDAQGKRKITEITAAAMVERNRLDREAEQARTKKDVETRQLVLELERQRAEAEASQGAEVAKIRAQKDRESQEAEILSAQAVTRAKVSQEQSIKEAEIARDLAVQAANIARQRELILREQEQQQTEIERMKTIELAERQKQISVAERETERAKAEQTALEASAERERANQSVVTVTQLAEADREAQKKLIAAKQEIERNKIAEQTQAEVQAYTRVKQAEAELESAEKQAAARLQMADAEAQSRKLIAEGEAAQQMVPVQVERERVNVKQAEVAVEAQALENRQKFAEAGIELEIQRLRISADRDVQMALAQAIGQSLSSAKMTLYGTPDMASSMLQSMAKGMGVRHAIAGFTGNGHDLEADGEANPLEGLADMILPIVERFRNSGASAETMKAAVADALKDVAPAPVVTPAAAPAAKPAPAPAKKEK